MGPSTEGVVPDGVSPTMVAMRLAFGIEGSGLRLSAIEPTD